MSTGATINLQFVQKINFLNTFNLILSLFVCYTVTKIMEKEIFSQIEYALLSIKNGDESGVDALYELMGGRMLLAARGIDDKF